MYFKMNKFTWIFLNIITFGILRLVATKKAKRISSQINQELIKSEKLPFDLDQFINILGGLENIQTTQATLNMIKINVVDKTKVNQDQIKSRLKINGIMWASHDLSLVCGDYASSLSEQINQLKNR
ncbi:putative PTS system glucose-specific enzyme IIB PtsG [Mycoplasmoides gallisepticum CA06_2006.052-5-2P]|uniref:PTS system glucose-specific enzyme IIB PtsG n=2 Tax=Mycoplasmoides gallisepticum TaxID=2096 RepID=Q7NAU1_MYCGA|nr:putative PTS system glucose-specific enzyme IIB PtsG [Mycoplasmoides gallisepticum str. R(low)]ADC30758.1 putative PTS system glucose-specific enzyme IIB PtsG [Mycoplasmoides gallisepticum str. R(high)]AFP76114.1 putative PTS system glucose-specific enzyme IIB PtsG [Mycoplasmoides gallisepticum VA94_7994-1-7P]AFP76881.1 putative PTS system glucose-specific enzyme IIB PtsG [Mycoplasmoides gallisepticum NC95_13295-2-2P]AFP77639.1 putative PTS system glucose-specific enzyme IIB PtsG [Mycoplasmo